MRKEISLFSSLGTNSTHLKILLLQRWITSDTIIFFVPNLPHKNSEALLQMKLHILKLIMMDTDGGE